MTETPSRATARTTAPLPFYSYNAEQNTLFSINRGVPLEALLDNAQCFMSAADHTLRMVACEKDLSEIWGAYYMVQFAGALIESLQRALVEESSHV